MKPFIYHNMAPITDTLGYSFSVMTVNVRFGLADSGKNSWENRKTAFSPLFERYQPDFICMQEVNHFQSDFFQANLQEYEYIGRREPAPDFWQDVLIFYKKKWVCHAESRFFLTDTPDIPSRLPASQWPRQCVMGRFNYKDHCVVCVNTHFDFDDQVQQKSARIILKRLADFSPEPALQILTGDFNASPDSNCYKIFTTADGIPPFRDVFDGETRSTFHNFTGDPTGDRIDWILWRGDAVPVEKTVITEKQAGRYPSDHFPVYTVFGGDGKG